MSDRSKVPPPPWAAKGSAPRSSDPPAPGGEDAGAPAEGAAWPSLDELAGSPKPDAGGAPAPAPPTQPESDSAPWEASPPRRAPDPEREAISLDVGAAPGGPQSPYAGADEGPPPEPPQRTAPADAPARAPTEPAAPEPPAAGPRGATRGAAANIIRTSATPTWRILMRFVVPAVAVLLLATAYQYWVTKSAFKTVVTHGTIMGFDANILDAVEELAEEDGYKLGKDGVQGWIMGDERRWYIRVHVRCRALFVVPYYTHFVHAGDLPYNMHVETHLFHFTDDVRWSFDEAIIQQFMMMASDRPNLAAEVQALRQRSEPPPR